MSERSTTSASVRCCFCKHDVPEDTTRCMAGVGTQCKDSAACRARRLGASEAPDKTSGEGSDPMRLAGACSPSTTTTPAREPGEAGTYFRCPTCGVGRIGTNTACAECKRYYLGKVSAPGDRPDYPTAAEELADIEVVEERKALLAIANAAQAYHEACGHDLDGAASKCDPVCDAWKAWRALVTSPKRGNGHG